MEEVMMYCETCKDVREHTLVACKGADDFQCICIKCDNINS
jgi:hypothetical protein